MSVNIPEIFAHFSAEGAYDSHEVIPTGHIHATYRVATIASTGPKDYLLQQINTKVFRDPASLMHNILQVTRHVRQRLVELGTADVHRRVLTVIPDRHQQPFHETVAGEYWRLFDFVADTHTVTDTPDIAEIYQAAFAFGEFIALLADLPLQHVTESIPRFHHGPSRYQAFVAAVEHDACCRKEAAKEAIEFIAEHHDILAQPQRLIDEHVLPLRVTHNDTKSNNVLLDNTTNCALCVIDLDTVMPGLALYDFGDLVRTTATGVAEDEPDGSRVTLQVPRIEQALQGFIDGAGGRLTPREVDSLLLGPVYMSLIMAVRFLTDHLQGDVYYRIHHTGHNLQRCRTQLALVQALLEASDEMAGLVG